MRRRGVGTRLVSGVCAALAAACCGGRAIPPAAVAAVAPTDLVAVPAPRVLLRLLGADDGPLANCEAWVDGDARDRIVTDAGGWAELRQPPLGFGAGPLRLTVSTDGFADRRVDVDLSDGRDARVACRLGDGVTVSGRVTRADGSPVGGSPHDRIVLEPSGDPVGVALRRRAGSGASGSAVLGEDGSFRIYGLAPGTYRAIVWRDRQYVSESVGTVDAPCADARLVDLGATTARVSPSSASGEAVRDAVLVFLPDGADWDGPWVRTPSVGLHDPVWVPAPGRWRVRVLADGFVPAETTMEYRPGAWTPWLPHLEPARPVAGRVVDAAGAPVAGARVTTPDDRFLDAARERRFPRPVVTGPDGAFVIRSLGSGATPVTVVAPGFVPATVDVDPAVSQGPVTLRLDRGGRVSIVCRSADGTTLPCLDVRVRPSDGRGVAPAAGATRTDVDGTLALVLVPGRYAAEASHPVFGAARAEFEVRERAAAADVPLVLR